jgi:hypothetical protein
MPNFGKNDECRNSVSLFATEYVYPTYLPGTAQSQYYGNQDSDTAVGWTWFDSRKVQVTFIFSNAFKSVLGHIQFPVQCLQLAIATALNVTTQLRTMLVLRKRGAPPSFLHMPKWREA